MSPEKSQVNHDVLKQLEATRFSRDARMISAESADWAPANRVQMLAGWIDKILAEAVEGKIASGDYSEEEVRERLFAFKNSMRQENSDLDEVSKLIPSSGGLREAVKTLYSSDTTREALIGALEEREAAMKKQTEQVVGHQVLDIAGVMEPAKTDGLIEVPKWREMPEVSTPAEAIQLSPTERLAKLTEGLSDDDRLLLRSYADAVSSKKQAQQDGDGQNSEYWGQIAGQTQRELSPQAQAVMHTYAALYNRMN